MPLPYPRGRLVALALAGLLCGGARADEGMWLLNKPPLQTLKTKYGFEPTAAWLEHVQRSAVHFGTGGSGSIISADGLVMTNHHVGSDMLDKLSTKEINLLETGFYAKTRDAEPKCPDLELKVLWTITDVTDRVMGAVKPGASGAEANAARRQTMSEIEKECTDKTGLHGEVVTLYKGGKYQLYAYKTFTDVRLVFAPEQSAAFFGGDTDNFEFPRYNLDICLFRIYENGKPIKPEHFLKWSPAGSKEGDLAIVIGHPGSTSRLYTMDHLKFARDRELPLRLAGLWRSEVQYQCFNGRDAENAREGSEDLFGVANSRKALMGQLGGLLDPAVIARKAGAEKKLRDAVNAKPEWKSQWGNAWEKLAGALKAREAWHARYTVLWRGLRSELFVDALELVRLADELPKPSGERLREYRDSALDSLYLGLYSPAPIHDNLEIFKIASGLSYLAETLGADDPTVWIALAGKSPQARAEELVKGTTLKDVGVRKKLAAAGKSGVDASKDPLIRLAASLDYEARALRKQYEDTYEAVERDAYTQIAAAKFAVEGENTYPDATGTLRMAFGPVKGYQEEGRTVAPYTTLGGTFVRYEERKGQPGFELPKSWLERKDKLDAKVPFNFVCAADIIGGNSGSPVINTAGEVIGLIFDGNVQSLPGAFVYDDTQNRAVAVDSRGIVEAIKKIYDAGDLVKEMTGK